MKFYFTLLVFTLSHSHCSEVVLNKVGSGLYQVEGELFFNLSLPKFRNPKAYESSVDGPEFYKVSGDSVNVYRNHFGRKDKEKARVYLKDVIDIKTWQQVSSDVYVDKNHVYYHEFGAFITVVKGISPKDLKFLVDDIWVPVDKINTQPRLQRYFSDGKAIFCRWNILESVDFSSFRFIQGGYACDKYGLMKDGIRCSDKRFDIILKNLLDRNGELRNKSPENVEWVRKFNQLIEIGGYSPLPLK